MANSAPMTSSLLVILVLAMGNTVWAAIGNDDVGQLYYVPISYRGGSSALANCLADSKSSRVLPNGPNYVKSGQTLATCSTTASNSGSPFFGVEYGTECWTGKTLPLLATIADSDNCNMKCEGNSSRICGGIDAINLYAKVKVIGCYKIKITNDVTKDVWDAEGQMNVGQCAVAAAHSGYSYFGLSIYDGKAECWGEKKLDVMTANGPSTSCNVACPGDSSQWCGNTAAMNVYQLNTGALAPTPSPSPKSTPSPSPSPKSAPAASPVKEFKALLLTAASDFKSAADLFNGEKGTASSPATIGQWNVNSESTDNQVWTFKPTGTSPWLYTIVDYYGNCWDLSGPGASTGDATSKVVSQPCSANKKTQQWAIYNLANANFGKTFIRNSASNENCLAVKIGDGKAADDGNLLALFKCSASSSVQLFKMQYTKYVSSPPSPTKEGFHAILKTSASKFQSAVDLFNDEEVKSAPVTIAQWYLNGHDSQRWWFTPITGTLVTYKIQDHYGNCWDLTGTSASTAASGSALVSAKCDSSKATQKWTVWGMAGPAPENDSGNFVISNSVSSNTCLSVADGKDATKILVTSCQNDQYVMLKTIVV